MSNIQELVTLIEQHTGADGAYVTTIPGISLHRVSHVSRPHYDVLKPVVCIVAQGSKQMFVGETVHAYDKNRYLVISLDIPVLTEVVEASLEKPLLCAVFSLDPADISTLMIENDFKRSKREAPTSAITTSPLSDELLDTFVRLLRLLNSPSDIPTLSPLIQKELLYRLLRGEQSIQMSQIAFSDSKLHQISRAINWIKLNFDKPITIKDLATEVGMSRSSLHRNFQAVTGISPLHYQKQIRLQEARRLMLRGDVDSATASHLVGYQSPSQFNREYKRLFGTPPHRSIAKLRAFCDVEVD